MDALEDYVRDYPENLENRLFQRILLRLRQSPNVMAYYQSRGDLAKAVECITQYQQASDQLKVFFLTEELSVPLVKEKFVAVRPLNQRMSMEGIVRWEGYYEKNGI